MNVSDFDYRLPPELIAQTPLEPRDQSRLMVLHRTTGNIEHRSFHEIVEYLHRGDVLVFNNSRVIPARLFGKKHDSGANVELLLLRRLDKNVWETLVRPGKRIGVGTKISIVDKADDPAAGLTVEVIKLGEEGIRVVHFSNENLLEQLGEVPLPPYVHAPIADSERYQTVYATVRGSVAAPTAGLHFTQGLLGKLQRKGVQFAFVTLHIGLDTFRPVRVDEPGLHHIHTEYGELSEEAAGLINRTKNNGRKVIAVGTSTIRLVESAARAGTAQPFKGNVDLFILPGYQFRIVDTVVTNFHLPRSTLLMLISAFAGKDFVLQAYEQAKKLGYRFYSFGDAMLIL